MDRILYITSNRIGDAILASGALAHLAASRPGALFTVAVGPLAAPLFRAVPRLDELIVMRKRPLGGHWIDLWRRTAPHIWDEVVDLRGSGTSFFMIAKKRVIAGKPRNDVHKVVEISEVIGATSPLAPMLWTDSDARDAARAVLPAGRPLLALSPAAAAPFKEWPPDRFASLAKKLTRKGAPLEGAVVAAFGGPGDVDTAQAALEGIGKDRALNLAGAFDLSVVGAVLSQTRLFVGNDSGLMHLAAAAGAPTLGLFGPTDERVYGPWGPKGRAVRAGEPIDAEARQTLKHASTSLLTDLPVAKVEQAARALLDETGVM